MQLVDRRLPLRFQIDTNRINSRRRLEHMNRLEAWKRQGLIEILMSEPAFDEVTADGDRHRSQKGMSYLHSFTSAGTPPEMEMLKRIERIVFPSGATSPNDRRDVEIVFNAWKYRATLITADGA
jgi:hypothetical protein